jgi:hypothetical protein
LKLKYDELLSTFAFNVNLRRYNLGARVRRRRGGAVQVDSIKTRFESVPGFSA